MIDTTNSSLSFLSLNRSAAGVGRRDEDDDDDDDDDDDGMELVVLLVPGVVLLGKTGSILRLGSSMA